MVVDMKDAWISVEDQLPEAHQDVLVHFNDGTMKITMRMRTESKFLLEGLYGKATHWQPLVPPEGVGKDGG